MNLGTLVIIIFLMISMWACAPVQNADEYATYNKKFFEQEAVMPPSGKFLNVVKRIESVAEEFCKQSRPQLNCDFDVLIDAREPTNVNAFQTLKENGRPVIVFTEALINKTRNDDELAFILGHEMAHHLEGHIHRQYQSARAGAILLGGLTAISGAPANTVESAQRIGAGIGPKTYSKERELEADKLGALISIAAGYDPVRGSAFLLRLTDPKYKFLGSHPPNADRIEIVRRVSNVYKHK